MRRPYENSGPIFLCKNERKMLAMESDNSKEVTIECSPNGHNGAAILTARLGGEVLAVESVNLAKPKGAEDFAQRLCEERPGVEHQVVEAELLRLAARPGQGAPPRPRRSRRAGPTQPHSWPQCPSPSARKPRRCWRTPTSYSA